VDAGSGAYAPADVIRAATAVRTRTLGQEKERYIVGPGKRANLVFVAKNPLDSVQAFSSVAQTVKRDHEYWRKDFAADDGEDQPKK